MFWFVIAVLSAVFTSMTTVLAKIGIKDVNSDFATLYRTMVVIFCSLIMCLITGSIYTISGLSAQNYIFLGLSGVATGLSWLCYYKALKLGDVNKVAPIDKSSYILTSILFFIFFFDETTDGGNVLTIIMIILSVLCIGFGTFLMASVKKGEKAHAGKWLVYAIMSAVFASFVSLFVKIGLKGISSDLGTFVRTLVVFVFALVIVLCKKQYRGIKSITPKSWLFLTLSGTATGGAWLCEYIALNMQGVNPVAVNSIGKLSILLTMAFSFFVLKEKFTKKSWIGLAVLTAGIVLVIVFSL